MVAVGTILKIEYGQDSLAASKFSARFHVVDATAIHDVLGDFVALSDRDVVGVELGEIGGNTHRVDGIALGLHRVEQWTQLAFFQPSHISDIGLTPALGFRVPERVTVANREELFGVDVPRSGIHEDSRD